MTGHCLTLCLVPLCITFPGGFVSSQRYELEDGFRGMSCLSDMSSKTASSKDAGRCKSQKSRGLCVVSAICSSKDAGRCKSQKSTKDVCAACLIARALSETTSCDTLKAKHASYQGRGIDIRVPPARLEA